MSEKSKSARKFWGWFMVAAGSLVTLTGLAAIGATFGLFGFFFGGPVAVSLIASAAIAIPGGLLTWLGLQMQAKAKHGLKLFERAKSRQEDLTKDNSKSKEKQNIKEREEQIEKKFEENQVQEAQPKSVKKPEPKIIKEEKFVQGNNSIAFYKNDGKTVLQENEKDMVFSLENKSNCNSVLRRAALRATVSGEDYQVSIKGETEKVTVLPLRHGHATVDCEKITSTIKDLTEVEEKTL